MKRLLVASTSTVHGSGYLEYILPELKVFYKGISDVIFIPYAKPSGITYDEYTRIASDGFSKINIKIKGIHDFKDAAEAIRNANGIFVGGGNTFLLVKTLYDNDLFSVIEEAVRNGTPYFGTSAGSNILGQTMRTTNDMPIIYPPSFKTLGLLPFDLNPHYLDPDINSTHKGETRETRIKEYHTLNDTPVLGLREGSWLNVSGDSIVLKGRLKARLFRQDKTPKEIDFNTNLQDYF